MTKTVVRSTFIVPFYELRGLALGALSPGARKVLQIAEDDVKAAKAAKLRPAVKGVNLKSLKKSLQIPQFQFHSHYLTMLRFLIVNKRKVSLRRPHPVPTNTWLAPPHGDP